MSFDPDYGPYLGHPQDPRTPDVTEREAWEESIAYSDVLDASTTDEILYELLRGSPDTAKRKLDSAVRVEFMLHQQRMKRHDFETRGEPA